MKFTHYKQLDQMDCGPACLRMVAKHFGRHYSAQTLREKAQISREGVSLLGIAEAAEAIGFKSIGVKTTLDKLIREAPFPCILHWGQSHFVVLYQVERNSLGRNLLGKIKGGKRGRTVYDSQPDLAERFEIVYQSETLGAPVDSTRNEAAFYIADPASGLISFPREEFRKKWIGTDANGQEEGIALLLEPTSRFYEEDGEQATGLQFRQLAQYLFRYKGLLLQLLLGMSIGSGLSLLLPFLTQSVVDVGIGTRNISFIYLVLIAQGVLLCSSASVDFLRSWILLHISTRLNLTILSEFLSKLLRLPLSFFDVKHLGDVMQRIGDHQRIEGFLTGQTLTLVFSFVNLLAFGIVLAYYHFSIFLVAIGASVVYSLWVILFLHRRRGLDNSRFDVASRNQSQIIQLMQGIQDIKLAGAETSKRWEWERTQARLFRWNVKSLSLAQVQQAGALLINQGKNIFITFIAAKAVVDGQMTLGAMVSVQYILGQFNSPVEQLVSFLRAWQDAQISLERLNEIHSLADEESGSEAKRTEWEAFKDIELRNISYTYPGAGNDPVLRDINLTIPHGKTTAIVGSSGSGKTTLLKLLLRFYEPGGGSIVIKSRDCTSLEMPMIQLDPFVMAELKGELSLKYIAHKAWRRQCGVVMQDGFIFSDSIARNIAIGEELIDMQKLNYAAQIANIRDFITSLPLGFDTKIGAEGSGISQGQKQRILIARSVYKDPALLLFDEATNSLDSSNEARIIANLNEFFKGRTVVVVAHRLSTVKHADQIVVMEKGRVVEIGTHAELVSARGKYFELVSNQLEVAQ